MKVIYSDIKSISAIPEKKQAGRVEDITVLKSPLEFLVFLLQPWKNPGKTRLHPEKLHKQFFHPLEILRPKTKTPGNSTLFLINPWKIHLPFLQYPWKFHILNPRFFFCNSPIYNYFNNHFTSCPLILLKLSKFPGPLNLKVSSL